MKRLLASLAAVVMMTCACSGESPEPRQAGEVGVETALVEIREVSDTVQSIGTVEAVREAVLSAKLMGVVSELNADEGDRILKGETLLVIDADDIRAKKSEAEHARAEGLAGLEEVNAAIDEAAAALMNADINLERMQALYAEKAVTKKELDDMTTQHLMAKARVEQSAAKKRQIEARIGQADAGIKQADVMLGYSVITSPLDGVVVGRMVHKGEMASPGMPLLKVLDDRRLRLVATVKEGEAGALVVGDSVRVEVDALGGTEVTGTIAEVVPAADPATRSFMVKVDLPRVPGLLPGMFGRAYLPVGARDAVVVPDGALVDREGVKGVYVVGEGGIIRFQSVSLGSRFDDGLEALTGLSGGENVVVGDLSGVREGMRATHDRDME